MAKIVTNIPEPKEQYDVSNQRQILEYLKHITDELTDAYNTAPDTPETSDTLYYIDTAKDLVDELTTRLEDPQEEPVPHEDLRKEKEFVC